MRADRPYSSPLFLALVLFLALSITGCSKEELVVPDTTSASGEERSGRDTMGSGITTPGSPNTDNGAISDDGDDQGDNEGGKKRVKP
jgi:hypothetical protein